MPPAKVAASILAADFARLGEQVKAVEPWADMIHVDMMDAHFVPPLSIGPVVVESLRPVTELPLHAHLMVERPQDLLEPLVEAGTNQITFHAESTVDPPKLLSRIREHGLRTGMAVNPMTPVEELFPHLDGLDNVIVMTLRETGWAGQPFQDSSLPKIESLRREIDRRGLSVDVEVDGGINEDSGRRCVAAGATVLAAASSVFRTGDPGEAARRLADAARKAER
jgi:ribulose-phosphate 3-epimerase